MPPWHAGAGKDGLRWQKGTTRMSVGVEAIQDLVGRQLGRRGVKADDHLMADLGVESIDVLNIVGALEEKYKVSLKDEEIASLQTVRDLHTLLLGKL
jgi:acyl carrier protein